MNMGRSPVGSSIPSIISRDMLPSMSFPECHGRRQILETVELHARCIVTVIEQQHNRTSPFLQFVTHERYVIERMNSRLVIGRQKSEYIVSASGSRQNRLVVAACRVVIYVFGVKTAYHLHPRGILSHDIRSRRFTLLNIEEAGVGEHASVGHALTACHHVLSASIFNGLANVLLHVASLGIVKQHRHAVDDARQREVGIILWIGYAPLWCKVDSGVFLRSYSHVKRLGKVGVNPPSVGCSILSLFGHGVDSRRNPMLRDAATKNMLRERASVMRDVHTDAGAIAKILWIPVTVYRDAVGTPCHPLLRIVTITLTLVGRNHFAEKAL